MTAKAIDVAKFLLYLSSQDPHVNDLSNLKLQKLLYYCQGTSFRLFGKPVFKEPIEAWQFGPVVKEVYRRFSIFGSMPIPLTFNDEINNLNALTTQDIKSIGVVWNKYSRLTASQLVEMTHRENPWRNAWRNNKKIINHGDIENEFTNISI